MKTGNVRKTCLFIALGGIVIVGLAVFARGWRPFESKRAAQTAMALAAIPNPPQGNSSYQAMPASQPDMPLKVTSATIIPSPEGRAGSFQTTVANNSKQDVLAYTIRWLPADASVTAPGPGGTCSSRFAPDSQQPLLRPGETGTDRGGFALRGPMMQAAVDFVFLSDGSVYGPNSCRTLQQMQQEWGVRNATEKWVLSVLQSQGAQALEKELQADLTNRAAFGKMLLNPNYHPPAPPSQ